MKRVVYSERGNPADVLRVEEVNDVELQPGQARVSVLRAPINPSDLAQVEGNYGALPDLPAVGGLEGVGRVTEINGDAEIEVGQLTLVAGGESWATEIVRNSNELVALPEADIDQLSMLSVNPATAYLLLSNYVELQEGDWIIQSAASSAVGRLVLQLTKNRGINVVCVVREEDADVDLESLGAAAKFIDGPDLAERVKAETGAEMKLALDCVAGETTGRLAETMAYGGTVVLFGGLSGAPAQMGFGPVIFNDVRMRGYWLAPWFANADPAEQAEVFQTLTMEVLQGNLHADVEKVYPLDQIVDAVNHCASVERKGKILLAPNGI